MANFRSSLRELRDLADQADYLQREGAENQDVFLEEINDLHNRLNAVRSNLQKTATETQYIEVKDDIGKVRSLLLNLKSKTKSKREEKPNCLNRLAPIVIKPFCGLASDWMRFKLAVEREIRNTTIAEGDKIYYLLSLLEGTR